MKNIFICGLFGVVEKFNIVLNFLKFGLHRGSYHRAITEVGQPQRPHDGIPLLHCGLSRGGESSRVAGEGGDDGAFELAPRVQHLHAV